MLPDGSISFRLWDEVIRFAECRTVGDLHCYNCGWVMLIKGHQVPFVSVTYSTVPKGVS